jgi:hypothetical protein
MTEQVIKTFNPDGTLKDETRTHSLPTSSKTNLATIVGIIATIVIGIIVVMAVGAYLFHPAAAAPVTPVIVPTPIPTPTPAPLETTNILTVTLMTTSGGFPQIGVQEDTRCFWVSWNDYDRIRLGDKIIFTLNGQHNLYNNIQYNVVAINIVGHRYNRQYDYPRYYDDNGRYYQYDGYRTDEVSWKQVRGEVIIRGRPPHY